MCTGLMLRNADGSTVHGRTVEFGAEIRSDIVVYPRGRAFTGTAPGGAGGKSYTAVYAFVGGDMNGNEQVSDGMNEAGLSVGAFYFPDYAGYAEITGANRDRAVAAWEFPNYLLSCFATTDEARQGLDEVVIAPTVYDEWGFAPPFHYVVYDRTGRSLAIEPVGGELVVHENPLGVFTNSPTFDWHMTNLRNYVHLSPHDQAPIQAAGMTVKPLGMGSGLLGLPGDFTPPSRFVRAAVFSQTALPAADAAHGILQVFHLLNQFDVPAGAVRETSTDGGSACDVTQTTLARDPHSLRYYWRTYDDQTIRMVDLAAVAKGLTGMKKVSGAGQQPVVDMTTQLG